MFALALVLTVPGCLDFGGPPLSRPDAGGADDDPMEGGTAQDPNGDGPTDAGGTPADAGSTPGPDDSPDASGEAPDAEQPPDAGPVEDDPDGGADAGSVEPDANVDGPGPCALPGGSEFGADDLPLADGWQQPGQVVSGPTSVDGDLVVQPPAGTGWFGSRQGYMLGQTVCGNFVVETDVSAQALDLDEPPNLPLSVAGLIARYPADDPDCDAGERNWEMIAVGTRVSDVGIETKSTTCSNSNRIDVGNTRDVNAARLRLCRIGDTVRMFFLRPGDLSWSSAGTSIRDSLPETLQVGIAASAWGTADFEPNAVQADLRASFGYLRFSESRPMIGTDCTSLSVSVGP